MQNKVIFKITMIENENHVLINVDRYRFSEKLILWNIFISLTNFLAIAINTMYYNNIKQSILKIKIKCQES